MSNEKRGITTFLTANKGTPLVIIQFLLMGVFILAPVWQPSGIEKIAESLHIPRTILAVLCGIIALLSGGIGSRNIKQYLTPLPYPVEDNELVTTGVYRLVRHPLYSSLLFAGFGWVVYTLSLSHLLLLIGAFFFFSFKAAKEEEWLTERHPEYAEYKRRVKKFIPFIY